jgi:hypothetical protein
MAFLLALGTGAKEGAPLSDWFSPFLKIYVLGYGPIIFFMIATLLFIIDWRRSKKEVEKTTPVPQPVLTKPKKSYTELNKTHLTNALTDLAEILNKYGPDIIEKAQYVPNIWILGSKRISLQDINNLITNLDEINNLSGFFYEAIYIENSIYKRYIIYTDELNSILQDKAVNPIPSLKGNIKDFHNVLSTIQLAKKYDNQELIDSIMTSGRPVFQNYTKSINIFDGWLRETERRIVAFRNSKLN